MNRASADIMQHLADHPVPVDALRPYRLETWTAGGTYHVLVAAQERDGVRTWVATWDGGSGPVAYGHARFKDPDALLASRAELASSVTMAPVTLEACDMLGLPGGQALLPDHVLSAICAGVVDHHDLERLLTLSRGRPMVPFPEFERRTWTPRPVPAARRHRPAEAPTFAQCPSAESALVAFSADDLPLWRVVEEVRDRVDRALAPLRGAFAPEVQAIIGKRNWTPEAHAFYAAPGPAGERRRQAGRLYPALARSLAHDQEVARLIDAGRPYEGALRDVVASWFAPADGERLTVAALRRFRGLPEDPRFRELVEVIACAIELPVDWLPTSQEGWVAFAEVVPILRKTSLHLGLPLEDMVRPARGEWAAFRDLCVPDGPYRGAQRMLHANDPANRLSETLLMPLVEALAHDRGIPREKVDQRRFDIMKVGGRLLYAGKSVFGILKASAHWHDNLTRLEAALPRGGALSSWPRMTEPYTAPNGIEVFPLGNMPELVAEGAEGKDEDGFEGLHHCVGGYGRQCFTGESHILSLRRPLPGGGFERLSTAEAFFDGAGAMGVVQHQARRNAGPSPEAERALESYLDAVNGKVLAVDPQALEKRNGALFDKPYDPGVPGNLERAFEAWRPFLAPASGALGLEGLKETLAAYLDTAFPPEAKEDESLERGDYGFRYGGRFG